jgi:hypothetical protein
VLLALAVIAAVGGPDFYWVDRALPSWPWLMAAALMVGTIKAYDEKREQSYRWVLTALLVLLVVGMGIGALIALAGRVDEADAKESPDGRFTVVVAEGAAMIDPVWYITIHQNRGLLSRQWHAGCLNGDDPANEYDTVSWTGPNTVEVRTGGGQRLSVRLAANGQPLNRVAAGVVFC